MITVVNANALHIPLPDQSVQCVITSPPYWALRSYLDDNDPNKHHELGAEPTPAAYVANIVRVMREVWRVLRDDGVLFLNLGDSYFGSGRGPTGYNGIGDQVKRQGFESSASVRRAAAYGTSYKALEDYQDHDCLCGNLCDVCRVVYQSRKSHNDGLLVSMLTASLSETSREHTESQSAHLPTLDSLNLEGHSVNAILYSENLKVHERARLRAVLVSMLGESSLRLLDVCLQRASRGECLLCARSLIDCAQGCADKIRACTCDTVKQLEPSGRRMLGKSSFDLAYPHYTTESLKPKDLCGIPWRVAFALQDDGWYLRSDIIWSKPNPMPESVTDRPTKAHEYVFLLTKQARYYYDAEAIKEPNVRGWGDNNIGPNNRINTGVMEGKVLGRETNPHGGLSSTKPSASGRNRRSVWTVATSPYSGAHFATFPPALVEPMILAGTSQRGACPTCGAGWVRVVDQNRGFTNGICNGCGQPRNKHIQSDRSSLRSHSETLKTSDSTTMLDDGAVPCGSSNTLGWRPACACYGVPPLPDEPDDKSNGDYTAYLAERQRLLDLYATLPTVPQLVLDPFAGTATVGRVCAKHGRQFIGTELNLKYITLADERTSKVQVSMPL